MTALALLASALLVTAQAGTTQATDPAMLRVGSRVVAVFRGPLGASSPAERAERAALRIARQLEAGVGAESVSTQAGPDGALVFLGDRPMFSVLYADADTSFGSSPAMRAQEDAVRLRQAVAEYHERRQPRRLLVAALLSVAATLALVVVLRLLVRLRAKLLASVPARALGISGFTMVRAEQMRQWSGVALTVVVWLAALSLLDAYATFVLTRFPWTRPFGEALRDFVLGTVSDLLMGAARAIPGLFVVALIFIIARLLAKVVGALLVAAEEGHVTLPFVHRETAEPTRKVAIALLWLLAIVVAYPYVPGSDTEAFKGISVFAGLLLTLGSSGVVGQAMSGLVLMYSRALRVGDFVRIADIEGTVTDLGLLSTKIRTNRLEEITIPSALVLGNNVKNYTRLKGEQGIILHTSVTIGYNAPWRQVHALLLMAAGQTAGIRREPAPFIRQTALSDFYVAYELNVHTDAPEQKPALLSALHTSIQDCFNEHGVQIMSPHFEADKEQPVVVPKARWFASPAAGPEPA